MVYQYSWKPVVCINADAQAVGEELRELEESLGRSPENKDVIQLAKDPKRELHKAFEWDPGLALSKLHVMQARHIMASIIYETIEDNDGEVLVEDVRVYENIRSESGREYVNTVDMIDNDMLCQKVIGEVK